MMPMHCLSAYSTCRKLHAWFNSIKSSVLHRLLLVVCCYSSAVYCVMTVPTAWLVASPCHLVNVQCRLYYFTAAAYVVTQAANTFRISCLNLKGITSLDLCVLRLEATCITKEYTYHSIKFLSIYKHNICTNTQKELLLILNKISAVANASKSTLHHRFHVPYKMLLAVFVNCHSKNKYIDIHANFFPI
jgi:hypothetical protein